MRSRERIATSTGVAPIPGGASLAPRPSPRLSAHLLRHYGVALLLVGALFAVGCQTVPNVYNVQTSGSLFAGAVRGEAVYVDVKNSSTLFGAEETIASAIRQNLTDKGYAVVDHPDQADHVLMANVRYSGLQEDALEAGNILLGAGVGAAAGGIGGAAFSRGHHVGGRMAGGALIGAATGAAVGYAMEEMNRKNTFVTVVDVQATNKRRNKTSTITIQATVAERNLTAAAAAARAVPDIAQIVAGQF